MQHCSAGLLMRSLKPLWQLCLGRRREQHPAPRALALLGARAMSVSSPPSRCIRGAPARARPERM